MTIRSQRAFARRRIVSIPLLFACASSACAVAPAGTPDATREDSSKIVGGTPVPNASRREVGLLFTGGGSECTGTLLQDAFDSRSYFVTASHCIDDAGLMRGGSFSVTDVGDFAVNGIWSLGSNNGWGNPDDVAVGELAWPVSSPDVVPARIASSRPNSGTFMTAVGFGCTSFGAFHASHSNDDGIKRFQSFVHDGGEDVSCPGDSGGPVFYGGLDDGGDIAFIMSGHAWRPFDYYTYYSDPVGHAAEIGWFIAGRKADGICYRVFQDSLGWLPVACNGDPAGFTDKNKTVRAMQIWSNRPGVSICYSAVNAHGWGPEVCDGDVAGDFDTPLLGYGLETVSAPHGEAVKFQVFVGPASSPWRGPTPVWQDVRSEHELAGFDHGDIAIEAMRLTISP